MSAPKKVAVLGGGAGALVAAFELTKPALKGQYDVTVYQMGWRLGGKGASGRNRKIGDRIEEHGLHIWMGFYDNAFTVMQEAYDEMGRTSGPLQKWDDAFKPHSYIVLEEPFAGGWQPWQCVFPTNVCTPGTGEEPPLWELWFFLLRWLLKNWGEAPPTLRKGNGSAPPIPPGHQACIACASAVPPAARPPRDVGCFGTIAKGPLPPIDPSDQVGVLLAKAHAIAESIPQGTAPTKDQSDCIVWLIQTAMTLAWDVLKDSVTTSFPMFQLWVALNLGGSTACGFLTDNIIANGWDSIDGVDLRAWLAANGANPTTVNSSPVRAVYDLAFAYAGGDTNNGQFAAGTAMSGMLRMVLMYKGAIFYKMQAGMGDTVFTPLYTVLKDRGVKFEFFHRVDALRLGNAEEKRVDAIDITVQARPKAGHETYDPLYPVLDLPCWPSEPLYERIEHGEELEHSGVDFESAWSPPWKHSTKKTLKRGEDFDLVVLGISVGAFPYMAKELITGNEKFALMVQKVQTVETCAFQLWMKPDLSGLGWVDPSTTTERPVLGAFLEPLDTWADMSQLLVRETWPAPAPQNVAYFCGPLKENGTPAPFHDHEYPAMVLSKFDARAIEFLKRDIHCLWPEVATAETFRWDALVDLTAGQQGEARFHSQFSRVNIDPSERYVLSVPGSTQHRLWANESGYENVILAGDWTQCVINAGCVEAAVTSGMLAAQAITGVTRTIAWVKEKK